MLDSAGVDTLHTDQRPSQDRPGTTQHVDPLPPVHLNQSSQLDRQVPRSFDLLPRYPPPPIVEDEASSLAKEHISPSVQSPLSVEDDVQFRGELEQLPILVPVHESNPERRFVYVGAKSSGDDGVNSPKQENSSVGNSPVKSKLSGKEGYEANTGRKYTLPTVLRPADQSTPNAPNLGYPQQPPPPPEDRRRLRRCRSELPRIETDVSGRDRSRNRSRDRSQERHRGASRVPSSRASRNHSRERSRDRLRAHSKAPPPVVQRTHSSASADQRPRSEFLDTPSDSYLSANPTIIKHSTNGRDRAYFDMDHNGPSKERPRSTIVHGSAKPKMYDDRGERRSVMYYERTKHYEDSSRRSASSKDVPRPSRTYSDRRSEKKYYHDDPTSRASRRNPSPSRSDGRTRSYGDGISSPPASERRGSPTRSIRSEKSDRSERKRSPPSRRPSQRDRDRDREWDRDRLRDRERDLDRSRQRPLRSDSYKSQRSSHNNSEESGDDHASPRRQTGTPRDRRRSFYGGDQNYLLSPDSATRPSISSRLSSSRRETPIASPRSSTVGVEMPTLPSPRPAHTFPMMKERRRDDDRSTPASSFRPSSPVMSPTSPQHARMPAHAPSVGTPAAAALAAGAFSDAVSPIEPTSPRELVDPMEQVTMSMPMSMQRQDSSSSVGSHNQWKPSSGTQTTHDHPEQSVVPFASLSDNANEGRVADLPVCPRRTPQAGLTDWLTFPRSENFSLCPDCYTGVFAETEYAHMFVPMPFRAMDRPLACDFGSSVWYRIAWLLTRKARLPTLQLLQNINVVDSRNQRCSGENSVTRVWHTVRNPVDNRPVERFTVCGQCAGSVQILFPNLAGIFQPLDAKAEPTKSVCSLHFSTDRLRFLDYFDLFEDTSERALARGSAPDLRRLCTKLRRFSLSDCARDERLIDSEWYVIRSFPSFTVCEECFEQVVRPEIDRSNPLARQFYRHPQRLRKAACQLYSARMRRKFSEACRANNLDSLVRCVEDRKQREVEYKSRIAHWQVRDCRDRVKFYEQEWQRWE